MPEEVCSICKKHIKFYPPYEDSFKIQGMCHSCENNQDIFIQECVEAKKRIDEYRKGINEPPGYHKGDGK